MSQFMVSDNSQGAGKEAIMSMFRFMCVLQIAIRCLEVFSDLVPVV